MAASLGIPRARMTLFENNKDTHDEAVSIAAHLNGKRVALVSSATHLPRAMALYRSQGLDAVPAPTDYTAKQSQELQPLYSYLPKGRYLMYSEAAIHEWIGVWWARLRGRSPSEQSRLAFLIWIRKAKKITSFAAGSAILGSVQFI
jgi:uncharacterized SAM-binding protein YcdF (DUF218 family)